MRRKQDEERVLERLIDCELRQLPDLPAPGALVHRVMLAVHRRESLPWYRRAWPSWPGPVQVAVLALLAAVSVAFVLMLANPEWIPGLAGWDHEIGVWKTALGQVWDRAGVLLKGLMITVRALGREILLLGVGLVLAGYLSSVALATACYRLARQRA